MRWSWIVVFIALAGLVDADTPFCENTHLLLYRQAKPTFCLGKDLDGNVVFKVWLAADAPVPFVQFAAVYDNTPMWAIMDDPNPPFVLGGIRRKRDEFTIRLSKFRDHGLRATEFRMRPLYDKIGPECSDASVVRFYARDIVDCRTKEYLNSTIAEYLGIEIAIPETGDNVEKLLEQVREPRQEETRPQAEFEGPNAWRIFAFGLGGILSILILVILGDLLYRFFHEKNEPDIALMRRPKSNIDNTTPILIKPVRSARNKVKRKIKRVKKRGR